jgi:hypothetical protein
MKQQSMGRHVAPHYSDSKPTSLALSPYCCMLSGEAINISFIVFDLTGSELEPMIYCSRGKHANHTTTLVVVMMYVNHLMDNKKEYNV